MVNNVRGLNPITFSVALLSFIGFLLSIITLVYHFDPINQHLSIAQDLDQLWEVFKELEHNPNNFPVHYQEQLAEYLESLEQDIQILMPYIMPTYSVCQRLKGWLYVWHMFRLSQRTKKAKIVLLSMIRHTTRLTKAKKSLERGTIDIVQRSKLEATARAGMNQVVRTLSTRDKDPPNENASMQRNGTIHTQRHGSLPLERRDSSLSTPAQGVPPPKRVNAEHSTAKSSSVPHPNSEFRSSLLNSPQQPAQAYHPHKTIRCVA